jgi:hypothetical protein
MSLPSIDLGKSKGTILRFGPSLTTRIPDEFLRQAPDVTTRRALKPVPHSVSSSTLLDPHEGYIRTESGTLRTLSLGCLRSLAPFDPSFTPVHV